MSWKDKIWYIVEYYKYHMLILIMLGCFVYLVASSIYRQTFTDVLYCAMVNNYGYADMNSEYFEDGFHEYGGFGEKDLVTIDSSMTIQYQTRDLSAELEAALSESGSESETSSDEGTELAESSTSSYRNSMSSETEYASMMKLSAMITAKALDVVIMDAVNMQTFASQGMSANLQTVLPEDLLDSLSDRIVYGSLEDGSEYPCGIRMEGTNAVTIGNLHIEDPVFSIVANTQNPDNAVLFLRYLLGEPNPNPTDVSQ
ncbi:MAG: hypothetical protein Q4D90_06185 [bacterium]|nr:hypothetical protein [bacterium]